MRRKRLLILLGMLGLMAMLGGCGEKSVKVNVLTESDDDVVSIPVLLGIDPETGNGNYTDLINGFNEEYAGQYRVDVQWITVTAEGYRERLKLLNALDQLPAIVTDAAFSAELYDSMIENGRFENLYPYMEGKEEWEEFLEHNSDTGEVYLVPLSRGLFSSAGFFYNKDMFAKAGINEFPDTWEELFVCMERLEENGMTPLALHGSGEYWSPMLISSAYMCSTEEGERFLTQRFPDSYDNDSMRELLNCMRYLYGYTFDDALEIDFDQAKERFWNGEAAILANGYWMIHEMDYDTQSGIGFAPFPGKMMMVDEQMSSWAVVSGYDEDVICGAVEFLNYREKNSEIYYESLTELEKDYLDAFADLENTYPNYQFYWQEEILNAFFNKTFPDFLDGVGTVEEFIAQMDLEVENIN